MLPAPLLLLNGTTLVKGGGVQACAGFVRTALSCADESVEWRFLLSPQVAEQVRALGFSLDHRFRVCEVSPARSMAARRQVRQLVDEIAPEAVFSFFGPAYVRLGRPHLCGVADGWVTHSSWLAYSRLSSWKARLHMVALCAYKTLWFRRANAWVVEAECARRGLFWRAGIPGSRVQVVPNNCGAQYPAFAAQNAGAEPDWGGVVRVLTLSAYYPHKNLELILEVAALLEARRPGRFRFVVTLPAQDAEAAQFLARVAARGLDGVIENVGPVSVADGPALYQSCHISFLPSLLETFSANYPEAMVMRRPIVTSDLDFARDVCGDAALYIDPLLPESAAGALERLVDDEKLRCDQIEKGLLRWRSFPDQVERYTQYRDILLGLVAASRACQSRS